MFACGAYLEYNSIRGMHIIQRIINTGRHYEPCIYKTFHDIILMII